MMRVVVRVGTDQAHGGTLLAPVGLSTPHQMPTSFSVSGATLELAGESGTGQMAALIKPQQQIPAVLTYEVSDVAGHYPEAMFVRRPNRFTRVAEALVEETRQIADARDGVPGITAIVNDVATKFVYGHPETRFNDGLDHIPALACGVTEGSCVEINTYLIAALRAAGFEAGYVTGYFFPAEKQGCCDDMHCWVVSRHDGAVLEWDIAHHLKLGKRRVEPALNPRPGARIALAHSMGLDFPDLRVHELKLLAEPIWVGAVEPAAVTIRMKLDEEVCRIGAALPDRSSAPVIP